MSLENVKKAVDVFSSWSVGTRADYLENGEYNPNKAVIGFMLKGPGLEYIEDSAEFYKLVELIKAANAIENQTLLLDKPCTAEELEIAMKAERKLKRSLNIPKAVDDFEPWKEKTRSDYLEKGEYNPNKALIGFLAKGPGLKYIEDFDEFSQFVQLVKEGNKIENAQLVLVPPYANQEDWLMAFKKAQINPENIRKAAEAFVQWSQTDGHWREYRENSWYEPSKALMAFHFQGKSGKLIKNYYDLCAVAELLIQDKKIINFERIKTPLCSEEEYTRAFLKSCMISPMLLNLSKVAVIVQSVLLVYMFFQMIQAWMYPKKPELNCWEPKVNDDILYVNCRSRPSEDMNTVRDCLTELCNGKTFQDGFENSWIAPPASKMTLSISGADLTRCSAVTFFECANKSHRSEGEYGYQALMTYLPKNNETEAETCDDSDNTCAKLG